MTAIAGPSLPQRREVSVTALPAHAGFVSRFVAFAIDLVVLAVAISAGIWFITTVDDLLRPWAHPDLTTAFEVAIPLIIIVYFVGLWRLSGQTVGKWLLGLRVVSTTGGNVSFVQGLIRVASYVLSAVPLYAGFLWVLVDPQRRALHDRLARTIVVYESPDR